MRRNILFVTEPDSGADTGLSYALELAGMIDKGLVVLMVQKKKLSKKFEDLMTAITFAEANEHETAKWFMAPDKSKDGDKEARLIETACKNSGIVPNIYTSTEEPTTAIKNVLSGNNGVEMVLLSHNIAGNGNMTSKSLKKLVNFISVPLVTLSQNKRAVAQPVQEVR